MSNIENLKILAIGDCHFKIDNLKDLEEFKIKLIIQIKIHQPDIIVVLGDVSDTFGRIRVQALTEATKFLYELSLLSKTYVLIGNHDRVNKLDFLTDVHPFYGLKYCNNLYIVDKGLIDNVKGHQLIFVPYVNTGEFNKALNLIISRYLNKEYNVNDDDDEDDIIDDDIIDDDDVINKDKINEFLKKSSVIFAHQEFRNSKMGAIISENGDIWKEDNPLVISGHIHEYDELQKNLYYPGTPFCLGFGNHSKKTISLFIIKSDLSFETTRIDLGLKKRENINLSLDELDNFKIPEDKIIKLTLTLTNNEKLLKKHKNIVKELQKKGIKVVYKYKNNDTDNNLFINKDNKIIYKNRLLDLVKEEKDIQIIEYYNLIYN